MNLKQPTLVDFENERSINKFCPPLKSNSFYDIGSGKIDLYCIRNDTPLFDLYIESGVVNVGKGMFYISGDTQKPYNSLTVDAGSTLNVNQHLSINKGSGDIHGTLRLEEGSMLIVNNFAKLTIYPDATFVVEPKTRIIVEPNASIEIYGDVRVSLSVVDSILRNSGIYLDSAAHLDVYNIDIEGRDYSVTDYERDLRSKVINPYTQGEYNTGDGRVGYTWRNGSPVTKSQCITLSLLWGQAILGDFRLPVLGVQKTVIQDLQVIQSFEVRKDTTLFISERYKGKDYVRPELYIGMVIGNTETPGSCIVDGTVYVDGVNSMISVDRMGTLSIGEEGKVYLQNGGTIRSTYNANEPILFINGQLIMEDVSQLVGFRSSNIVFGEKGKVIILNPDRGYYRLLLSIPNEIQKSYLYDLFKGRTDHVEYHVSNNCGIRIDEYFKYYGRDMVDWYGGQRIEKAIYDGQIVWHDGGVIELDAEVIPWVDLKCNLFHASRLFKSFSMDDRIRLREVTKQLKYAGCGNIVFRFFVEGEHVDVTMNLEDIEMISVFNKPLTDAYTLNVTNKGKLFLNNMVAAPTEEAIITERARVYTLMQGDNEILIK